MFKSIISNVCILMAGIILFSSCSEKVSPKPVQTDFSFTEEFDTVANLYKRGWVFINNSAPLGATTWSQGIYENGKFGIFGFPAYSYNYAATDYAYVESSCGEGSALLSCWMITAPIMMKNGDKISFYTRTTDDPAAKADRLQVRANYENALADVGNTPQSIGVFKTPIIDINTTYCKTCASAYPTNWVKLEFTVVNGSATPIPGRIAFRYFIEGGGPDGIRSASIGVDSFKFTSTK
jgi:hypothetical protein